MLLNLAAAVYHNSEIMDFQVCEYHTYREDSACPARMPVPSSTTSVLGQRRRGRNGWRPF